MTAKEAVKMAMLTEFYVKSFLLIGIGTILMIDGLRGAETINSAGIVGGIESFISGLIELIGILLVVIGVGYFIVLTYFGLKREEVKQSALY